MNNSHSNDPSRRQVLVNLGNRFVVFGPDSGLPEPIRFSPAGSPILPRVADESEVVEARITETAQVSGMTRATPRAEALENADLEFVDDAGNRILAEVKVRERDPKQGDLEPSVERLDQAKSNGQNLEIWFFNIERLRLSIMRRDGTNFKFDNLVPLNVWETTPDGVFERQRVVEEVEDWVRRIENIYKDVETWLSDDKDLRFETTRSVTMSEEMMQRFAVTDRDLAVLDVMRGDEVVASFVPRGLWLIGAWGRIDIITKDGTRLLIAIKNKDGYEWQLISPDDRRKMTKFEKTVLHDLVGGQ